MFQFKKVYIDDLKKNLGNLDKDNRQTTIKDIGLTKGQIKFIKNYFKFQKNFLKKIMKDNGLTKQYCIIKTNSISSEHKINIIMTQTSFLLTENKALFARFRLIKEKLFLEIDNKKNQLFIPGDISDYKPFFIMLLRFFDELLKIPSKFTIETIQTISANNLNEKIKFNQL